MTTELTPSLIGAIAVITAAFISFIVAVTSAVIAKEQKISEFRQKWIDELRGDIAELTALTYSYVKEKQTIIVIRQTPTAIVKLSNDYSLAHKARLEIMGDISKVKVLIQLRLNNTGEHDLFLKYLDELDSSLKDEKAKPKDDFEKVNQILFESHNILKDEWEKVKKGEKRYILFVSLGEFIGAVITVTFFVLFYIAKFPEYFPGIN
jgi:hypothetical protein